MLKEALIHLSNQAFCTTLQSLETHVPIQLVPDADGGVKPLVLEPYMEHQSRFREEFKTHIIGAFVKYFSLHGAKKAAGKTVEAKDEVSPIFVNPDRMCAMAIFDYGSVDKPLHRSHLASLELRQTAGYSALLGINGVAHSQRDLAEWLEDWEENITLFDSDGKPLNFRQGVRSIRKIDITAKRAVSSEQGDFKVERGIMESVDLDASETFPAQILFSVTPYLGLGERQFTIRTSLRTDDKNPAILTKIAKLEATKEEMAEEFCDVLDASITCEKVIGGV